MHICVQLNRTWVSNPLICSWEYLRLIFVHNFCPLKEGTFQLSGTLAFLATFTHHLTSVETTGSKAILGKAIPGQPRREKKRQVTLLNTFSGTSMWKASCEISVFGDINWLFSHILFLPVFSPSPDLIPHFWLTLILGLSSTKIYQKTFQFS